MQLWPLGDRHAAVPTVEGARGHDWACGHLPWLRVCPRVPPPRPCGRRSGSPRIADLQQARETAGQPCAGQAPCPVRRGGGLWTGRLPRATVCGRRRRRPPVRGAASAATRFSCQTRTTAVCAAPAVGPAARMGLASSTESTCHTAGSHSAPRLTAAPPARRALGSPPSVAAKREEAPAPLTRCQRPAPPLGGSGAALACGVPRRGVAGWRGRASARARCPLGVRTAAGPPCVGADLAYCARASGALYSPYVAVVAGGRGGTADAPALGAGGRTPVRVRFSPPAPGTWTRGSSSGVERLLAMQ